MVLGRNVEWLTRNIERVITTRMEDLIAKHPGAVSGNTRVIWIRMLSRPSHAFNQFHPDANRANVLGQRRKFNTVLEDVIAVMKYTHIMELTSLGPSDFDRLGNPTARGLFNFWKEIDKKLRKFDKGEIELKAIPSFVTDEPTVHGSDRSAPTTYSHHNRENEGHRFHFKVEETRACRYRR